MDTVVSCTIGNEQHEAETSEECGAADMAESIKQTAEHLECYEK
jgi:hypothetical protein